MTVENQEPQKPNFDPNQFKSEMTDLIRNENNMLLSRVREEIAKPAEVVNRQPEPSVSVDDDLTEYEEKIGVDRSQLMAMTDLVKKVASKVVVSEGSKFVSDMDQKIDHRVERQLTEKEKTVAMINEVASIYPDVTNPASPLTLAAYKELNNLPDHLKNSPEGRKLAVLSAASKLGIHPVKPSVMGNGNPTGNPPSNATEPKEAITDDLAAFFGVDKEKAELVFKKRLTK